MRALRYLTKPRFGLLDLTWVSVAMRLLADDRGLAALGVCMGGAVIFGAIRDYAQAVQR